MSTATARTDLAADPLGETLRRYLMTGDEEALEAVVAETRPRLLRAARRIGAPQDAEDAVQSAYLSLVRHRGAPLDAPVLPWLITAVIRIAYRRKALERRETEIARRLSLPGREGPRSPAAEAMDAEEAERLRAAVDRLPEKYRDPVVLHHLHGLATAEVGRLLDLPDATVRTRLRRARALLRWRVGPGVAHGLLFLPWFFRDSAQGAGLALASAATGGAMKAGAAAAMAVVAAGLGAAIGAAVKSPPTAPPPADPDPGALEARVAAERARLEEEHEARLAGLRKALAAAKEAEKARAEEERALKEKVASLEQIAAASAQATSGTGAPEDSGHHETDPDGRFRFAEFDEVLSKVDWGSVGETTKQMLPLIRDLRDALKEGKQLDLAELGRITQLNGALVREAAKIHEKLPGTGVNGAYTHPAFMVNAVAATLDAAGLPLSAEQTAALEKVGREFTDKDRWRTEGYAVDAPLLQRVLEEAALKDQFFDAVATRLTPEQREVLWPTASRGIVSLDLFSSGLLLAQFLVPLNATDRDGYAATLEQAVASRLGVKEDRRADLHGLVTAWAADLPDDWFETPTETIMGMQPVLPVSFVTEFGRRQLALIQSLLRDFGLPEEAAAKVRGSATMFVPVIRKGS